MKKTKPTKRKTKTVIKNKKRGRRRLRVGRLLFLIIVIVGLVYGCVKGYGFVMDKYMANRADTQTPVATEEPARETKPAINPQFTDKRFENYTNLLVIGVDDQKTATSPDIGRYADAIELLSFDNTTKTLRVITIPRNIMVKPANRPSEEALANTYFYGGAPATVQAISDYLQIPITQYIAIDRKALAKVIDALGGIDIYVSENMNYEDPKSDTVIHLNQGYQHLDGEAAQRYLSYRSDELGDIGRIERQQKVFKLLFGKFTTVEGVKSAPSLYKIFRSDVDTNVKMVSLSSMMDLIRTFNTKDITVKVLPGTSTPTGEWNPDVPKIKKYMDDLFPPVPEEKK